MRSQKIITYGQSLEIIEEEDPQLTGTQVLVKITHCGVCHSDLHILDGFFQLSGNRKLDVTSRRKLPFTLGHEIQGKVWRFGPEVKEIQKGQDCVVYPWVGCGNCVQCNRGLENLCGSNRCIGTVEDGGFSDYVVVPHSRYLLDPSGITDGLAGTYMCSGLTAYSALKKIGEIPKHSFILLIGLGGVGLMGLEIAKVLFGENIICADVDGNKRNLALSTGAHKSYDPREPRVAKEIVELTSGGVFAVVDYVGSESSVKFGRSCLQNGGKLILVGLFGGGIEIDLPLLALQGQSILGSITGSLDEAKELLELVKNNHVAPIPIEERSLDEVNATLNDLRDGGIVGRVVLTPGQT